MARKTANGSKPAASRKSENRVVADRTVASGSVKINEWFCSFAHGTARFAGNPIIFIVAVVLVIVWACTGPLFNYSDTWQLVINTSTTIITFLMVFVIQNTQNRDGLALQLKLAELIIAMHGAKNSVALAEDMSEEELEKLHEQYRSHAETTLASLEHKRSAKAKR